jgi:GrpB-like predicted nucleotidyltransferase (UPF0157 family)
MKTFSKADVLAARKELAAVLRIDAGLDTYHVGSTYISGGMGNDLDLVAVVGLCGTTEHAALKDAGYTDTHNDGYEEDGFRTFRNGDLNVMLTHNREWARAFAQSAEVCKVLGGPLDKVTRVAIHRVIMNRETAEDALENAELQYGEDA